MSHAPHLYDAVVLAGLGGQHLVEEIAGLLGLPNVGTVRAEPSADGECNIRLGANCRGRQVFVVQSISNPSSDRLIELSLICSALRRSSARRIIAVTPYYAFGRQNRKVTSRVPISAADAAVLIEESGCDQVVAIDLHCGQIEGFFSPRVGFDNVSCIQAAARHLFKFDLVDPVVVAIHATGVAFAKELFELLGSLAAEANARALERGASVDHVELPTFAMLLPASSARSGASGSELELIGEIQERDVVIVDDMIDSGRSIHRSVAELSRRGARRVLGYATHAVFSDGCLDRLVAADALTHLVVTDTIPLRLPHAHPLRPKLTVLSVAPVLAHTIAGLAGMPAPHVDAHAPTFPMHIHMHGVSAEMRDMQLEPATPPMVKRLGSSYSPAPSFHREGEVAGEGN